MFIGRKAYNGLLSKGSDEDFMNAGLTTALIDIEKYGANSMPVL